VAPRPAPHPEPPADLDARPLPLREWIAPCYRLHAAGRDVLHFGRSGNNRYDAPAAEFGVLYAGEDLACACIETYGQATGVRIVTVTALRARDLARLQSNRPLRLVDLTGPGLARLGADERLCAGEHRLAQRWALGIWSHPSTPDGLLYRARHDPSRAALALFDRAGASLQAVGLGNLMEPAHASILAAALDAYGFGLIDDKA
jgi:hypothetical protein